MINGVDISFLPNGAGAHKPMLAVEINSSSSDDTNDDDDTTDSSDDDDAVSLHFEDEAEVAGDEDDKELAVPVSLNDDLDEADNDDGQDTKKLPLPLSNTTLNKNDESNDNDDGFYGDLRDFMWG